jgi:hypothetical protein
MGWSLVLPEILDPCGLPLEQALEVEAGLGLVEEHHLHVDVVARRVEEVSLESKVVKIDEIGRNW